MWLPVRVLREYLCSVLVSAYWQWCYLLGMHGGTDLALLVETPHWRFSRWSQCCGWSSPFGSYCDWKMHLSNNPQWHWKTRFNNHKSEGYLHTQSYRVRSRREGEGKKESVRERDLSSLKLGCLEFLGFTLPLLMNLKRKRRIKMGRIMQGHSRGHLCKSPRAFWKGSFTAGLVWLFIW